MFVKIVAAVLCIVGVKGAIFNRDAPSGNPFEGRNDMYGNYGDTFPGAPPDNSNDLSEWFKNLPNQPSPGLSGPPDSIESGIPDNDNPFDMSKMMAGMNGMGSSNGLDELMANMSAVMKQLDGLNGQENPFNFNSTDSSFDFSKDFQGMGEEIEQRLESIKNRVENLEDDVAVLKNSKTQVSSNDCPKNFVNNPETGSCYFFSEDRKDWKDALIACVRQHGAYLLNIESPQENRFVSDTLESMKAKGDYYMGGRLKRKTFRWSHTNEKVRYADWGPGEPNNNSLTKERCMEIGFFNDFLGYRWRDTPCSSKQRYICEKLL